MNVNSLWEELIFELGTVLKSKDGQAGKIIPGSGNRNGRILFIGDEPDLYLNEKLGVSPGSSGEFLIKLCDASGLEPNDYYITTLAKGNMKFKDFFEDNQETLKELLHMQIALINPEFVVIFGERVAEVILEREIDFKRERGVIKKLAGDMKVIVTFDPYFAKKSRESGGKTSSAAVEFWNDLKLLGKEIEK